MVSVDMIFQSSGLLYSKTTVLFAPPVVGLFGDPNLPAGFADASSLIQQDLSFAQLVDNLLRCVRFPDRLLPPFLFSSLTLKLDQFLGGR